MFKQKSVFAVAGFALVVATINFPVAVRADDNDFEHREARFVSGTGTGVFIVGGLLLPLVEDGKNGTQHTLRIADSLMVTGALTELLKHTVREKRPESDDRTSFPSGHASAAFAVATMESEFHPEQALWWYGGATLIAASRVQLHRHFIHDVIAGGALGYGISRWELHRSRGLVLFPFIHAKAHSGRQAASEGAGLAFTKLF